MPEQGMLEMNEKTVDEHLHLHYRNPTVNTETTKGSSDIS